MSTSAEERAQEFGAMQGTVSALKGNIDALANAFGRFEIEQRKEQAASAGRLESILKEQLGALRAEYQHRYDLLQKQIDLHSGDLEVLKHQTAQLNGERLHAERSENRFRWFIGVIIALLTLLFGEHITSAFKGK